MDRGSCMSEIDPHFHITATVFKRVTELLGISGWKRTYRFQITIHKTDYDDSGIYFMQSNIPFCTIFRITIIVQGTLPLCSAFLLDGSKTLELSCRWDLQEPGDNVQLMAGNKTLQHFTKYELISGTENVGRSLNFATIISTVVAIRNAFDNNRVPDSCVVSDFHLDFKEQCKYSVYMSPGTNEITDFEQKLFYTCCTKKGLIPNVWWDNIASTAINTTGQDFTVDIDALIQNTSDGKISVIFSVYGEENNTQIPFGIGKLVLNLQHHGRVQLFVKIEQDREDRSATLAPNKDKTCTQSHIVVISARPIGYEHNTQGSTFHFSLFYQFVLITVILALSIFLNIAFCVNKYVKTSTSRSTPTTEGNEIGVSNLQTNPTLGTGAASDMSDDICDFPSSSPSNHRDSIPDSEATHEAEETNLYMNNPIDDEDNSDCVYTMPDKTWNSKGGNKRGPVFPFTSSLLSRKNLGP